MTELPTIKAVKPLAAPYRLHVVFKGGRRADVDLTGVVFGHRAFAPLRDPERFRRVRVVHYGAGIGWNDDLDYSADSLAALADAQAPFGTRDFRAWQERLELSNRQAADMLDISIETVNRYRAGARIPGVVALACRAVEHNPAFVAARYRPRKAGRPRKASLAASTA
jgi:hypothetical protein